ncbi:MAG: hypothetical protein CSA45_04760 [Gammaproteobacteria bacterium]|nr:MAG: hypothetical protein CSA45_04760 [Gammaproteobacteria bacterium]
MKVFYQTILSLLLGLLVTACAPVDVFKQPSSHFLLPPETTRQADLPAAQAATQAAPTQAIPAQTMPSKAYRTSAPQQYLVKRGDTLWSIAQTFLNDPTKWPHIWHNNRQINNPHLIYPGDMIRSITVDGKQKLYLAQRAARHSPNPIATLPMTAIAPFMEKHLILSAPLSDYPRLVRPEQQAFISLSDNDTIYAKGHYFPTIDYDIYRQSHPVLHPVNNTLLGSEVRYVGRAKLISSPNKEDIATLKVVKSVDSIQANDIIVPHRVQPQTGHFSLQPATFDKPAFIVKSMGRDSSENITQLSTILVSAGSNEHMQLGDTFYIVKTQTGYDLLGKKYPLPDKTVGIGVIYKTFDRTSLALVTDAYQVIYPGYRLVTP